MLYSTLIRSTGYFLLLETFLTNNEILSCAIKRSIKKPNINDKLTQIVNKFRTS